MEFKAGMFKTDTILIKVVVLHRQIIKDGVFIRMGLG